jgi:hypothetical protein
LKQWAIYNGYITNVSVVLIALLLIDTRLPSNSDQLLSDQWRSAVHSCRDPLQLERDDLRQILEYNSWDDLQDQLAKSKGDHAIQQEFAMLAHGLLKLRTFSDTWMCQVSPRVDVSVLWGMIRLVLKVCLLKSPKTQY